MKNFILPALLVLSLFACKKDNVKSDPPEEKMLMDSVISLDPLGRMSQIQDFDYDTKNRMVKVTISDREKVYQISSYTYDDADDLIKTVYLYPINHNQITINEFRYTDTEIQRDAIYEEPFTAINHTSFFTVSNKRITSIRESTFDPLLLVEYDDKGNAVKIGSNVLQYGTHKSPAIYSGGKWPLLINASIWGLNNEILKQTLTTEKGVAIVTNYTYKYNDSGYPVEQTSDNLFAPKVLYKYIPVK